MLSESVLRRVAIRCMAKGFHGSGGVPTKCVTITAYHKRGVETAKIDVVVDSDFSSSYVSSLVRSLREELVSDYGERPSVSEKIIEPKEGLENGGYLISVAPKGGGKVEIFVRNGRDECGEDVYEDGKRKKEDEENENGG